MLYAICNIQEMVYRRDYDRADANIVHFYLKTLEFAALHTKPGYQKLKTKTLPTSLLNLAKEWSAQSREVIQMLSSGPHRRMSMTKMH